MASIYKRGKFQYEVKIRRKGYPVQQATFETKKEAEDWACDIERDMRRGVFRDLAEAEKNTFGEILKRYKREITPRKKSAKIEEFIIDNLLRTDLAQLKMTAMSGSAVAGWRDLRLKDVSGSTVNREIDVISSVINLARKEWGIHIENPIALITRPPKGKARERRLVSDEEQRLLEALEETPRKPDGTFDVGARNPWLKPIVQLAIETAMRRGELLSLDWQHIDLKHAVAHLPDTKNGDSRDVPLSKKAARVLQSLPRAISGAVFPISPNALKKGFERACERAGIENLHFHDLRHEAASRISMKLSNVLELSAVTGHRDLRMLKRYYHPRAADLAKKLG